MSISEDLARYLGREDDTARDTTSASGDVAEIDERVDDHLRRDRVRDVFQAADQADPGSRGEAARHLLRCLVRPFLGRAVEEQDGELQALHREHPAPAGGYEAALAVEPDRERRRSLYDAWETWHERSAENREAWAAARDEAARSLGARGVSSLLAAEHPIPIRPLLETYERGAITPLDQAVAAAARARRKCSRVPLLDGQHAADTPLLAALVDQAACLPREEVAPLLGRLGRVFGADPELAEPDPDRMVSCGAWSRMRFSTRPTVVVGPLAGPAALASALGAFGAAARAQFLAERFGLAQARWSDPGFSPAAGVLFRRLALSSRFLDWAGVEPAPGLRFEESVAPRQAWSYLVLAGERRARLQPVEAVFRRATGRSPTPDQRRAAISGDPWGAAALRGTVYGVLLEERLLSQWGHEWYAAAGARRFLQECWEAEPGETVESMADQAGLGTIEPTPILDRCRP